MMNKMNKINFSFWSVLEITVLILIFSSGLVLFIYEKQNQNLDYNKSWTAFSFLNAYEPQKGAQMRNHLGKETQFTFCLVEDNNNLTEPEDLSCNLTSSLEKKEILIRNGQDFTFTFNTPQKKSKYWILAEYKDNSGTERNKILSFLNDKI